MALDYSVINEIFTPEERADLKNRSTLHGVWLVVHCWAVIFGAMAVCAYFPNPVTFIVAIAIIGCRQLGFAVLMHDASHGLLSKNTRLNDWLGIWATGQPIASDMRGYRPYHLSHHRNTQQPNDPDLSLSSAYPLSKASFARKMIRDITGQTFWRQRKAQFMAAFGPADAPLLTRLKNFLIKMHEPLIVNGIMLAGLSYLGYWYFYPLLWLLPLATAYQVITRIRNMAEHGCMPDDSDIFRNARTVHATWLMRAFLAPYMVNFHVEHHLMIFVPSYNLPKMHKMLMERGYGEQMEHMERYRDVLKLCIRDTPQQSVAA